MLHFVCLILWILSLLSCGIIKSFFHVVYLYKALILQISQEWGIIISKNVAANRHLSNSSLSKVRKHNVSLPTNTSDILPVSVLSPPPPPIISSYNDHIWPLLDVVDKLVDLKVWRNSASYHYCYWGSIIKQIQWSRVFSRNNLSLRSWKGICTRVSLISRLLHHSYPDSELFVEYMNKTVKSDESNVLHGSRLVLDLAWKGLFIRSSR